MTRPLAALWLALGLAGCAGHEDFMREPHLSPVGSGLLVDNVEAAALARGGHAPTAYAEAPAATINLFSDPRVTHVGDIVTVLISINDKATLGNSSDRSTTAKTGLEADGSWQSGTSSSSTTTTTGSLNTNSTSASQGQGNINRSEQIQVSVAAVVTQVLPNGNLVISGSQEVRVNYELRQLTVAGVVRPDDIAHNTIAYDHIAEARISYGGRGRISEVQQPAWGQQIYDMLKPF